MDTAQSAIEAKIKRKVDGSQIYVVLGLLGAVGLVLCPLAYLRTTQALRMIDEYHVCEDYRGKAESVRRFALVVLGFWLIVGLIFGAMAILGLNM